MQNRQAFWIRLSSVPCRAFYHFNNAINGLISHLSRDQPQSRKMLNFSEIQFPAFLKWVLRWSESHKLQTFAVFLNQNMAHIRFRESESEFFHAYVICTLCVHWKFASRFIQGQSIYTAYNHIVKGTLFVNFNKGAQGSTKIILVHMYTN